MFKLITQIIFFVLDTLNYLKNLSFVIQGAFFKITPIDAKRDYLGIKHNGITFLLKSHEDLDEFKLKFLAACSNLLLMKVFKGQKIYVSLVSKKTMMKKYKHSEDVGGFSIKSKTSYFIYIRNDLNLQLTKLHFIHEMGHVLDMILAEGLSNKVDAKYSELDKDFKLAFQKEKFLYGYQDDITKKMKLLKYGTSITEYFAQSFCYTVLGEAGFIVQSPKTYKIISDILYT